MKRIFVLLVFCAFTGGCHDEDHGRQRREEFMKSEANDFLGGRIYVKDWQSNLNLCFVMYRLNRDHSTGFTNVPCTPAVEALLINKREKPREKPCEKQCSKNAPSPQPERME